MLLPAVTVDLSQRIEQVDLDYSTSRLAGMQQTAGNPLQIEIRQFGHATAFLIRVWPDFWYGNKVLGLDADSEPFLDQIAGFFEQYNLACRFEFIPSQLNSRLASHLHQLGFCQMGFSTAMYGQPSLAPPTPPGAEVSVRAVRADEIDLFLDLYQAGFGLPTLNDVERDAVRTWLEQAQANLELCLAEVDQTPAGVGILYAKNGFGLLADAVTLPAFRGRDCHAALIHYSMKISHQPASHFAGYCPNGGLSIRI